MTGLWLDLLGRAWQLVAAGFVCAVFVGIVAGPGDDYSCAPAEDDEGEQIPEDPDRERDWDIADAQEAM